jgi:hypothetical protein
MNARQQFLDTFAATFLANYALANYQGPESSKPYPSSILR